MTDTIPRLVLVVLAVALGGAPSLFAKSELQTVLGPVLGEEKVHVVRPRETLHDIAYQYRLGFDSVRRLNRTVDPWLLTPGSLVRLPTRYILPSKGVEGLIINLPEARLYDFTRRKGVGVLAVSTGDRDTPTPVGRFRVGRKLVDPIWHVPRSIRRAKPHLPDLVPACEDNPLGSRWMSLGTTSYGIHGTNVRWSIGRAVTHGCVRLYEDVMQSLFERTPPGTLVVIVYEPYKWGIEGTDIFLEAHPDFYGRYQDPFKEALVLPKSLGLLEGLDMDSARAIVSEAEGIPMRVGSTTMSVDG